MACFVGATRCFPLALARTNERFRFDGVDKRPHPNRETGGMRIILRTQSGSVRMVGAEDFGQRFSVDEVVVPLFKLIAAGGKDTPLNASG